MKYSIKERKILLKFANKSDEDICKEVFETHFSYQAKILKNISYEKIIDNVIPILEISNSEREQLEPYLKLIVPMIDPSVYLISENILKSYPVLIANTALYGTDKINSLLKFLGKTYSINEDKLQIKRDELDDKGELFFKSLNNNDDLIYKSIKNCLGRTVKLNANLLSAPLLAPLYSLYNRLFENNNSTFDSYRMDIFLKLGIIDKIT